ncbi:MAG: hypothetical protein JO147_12745 [Actinobacteria bacterium]|nr:hypothetical protein [Actinomycetota bacterium]
MPLSDGAVALLADQVAELVRSWLPDADRVDVRITPQPGDDPYRWPGRSVWSVDFEVAARGEASVRLSGDLEPVEALERLVDGLGQLSESPGYWGRPVPPCRPGHAHPARVDRDGPAVVIRCPSTGETVARMVAAELG